ncbi:hypothetical protein Tco_0749962 [Tanacetum coccineum]|uniref:Gag-Pol polyprotein n=1 Tax=Tanacetum coccineum TaxID=301880 RepID=A0ABQ4Z0Y6_9ASTR
MSTQQDIYAVGSENHQPVLNKDNYVPWSSRDLDRKVPVAETFHEQLDEELTEKEVKSMEVIDQAIQTILMGLPEDIYVAVDSCKLLKKSCYVITSTDGESIESYYHRFSKLMNDFKRNKHSTEKIASNLKFLNNLQPEWSRHVTIVHQTKDLHEVDYTQLYDFLKYNQVEINELRAERIARTHDHLALMANSNNPYNYPVFHQDQPSHITYIWLEVMAGISLDSVQNVGNPNGLIVVLGIANPNANHYGNGNVVATRAKGDLDEIKEVNANCILMANLQQASTYGTQTNKALVCDSDGSSEVHHDTNCYDNDIFNMFTQEKQYTELLDPITEPHII